MMECDNGAGTVCREREMAVDKLKKEMTIEALWEAIVVFQDYPFCTASGLPFRYMLKNGRNGEPTKELWIDRRENSKSLAWSSIRLAFQNALSLTGEVVMRPKGLGDIRGVSYIYPLFWRFGVITVPEKTEAKMSRHQECEDEITTRKK